MISKNNSLTYKDAGVNIDAGNRTIDLIKENVRNTFNGNVLTGLGSFGSLFSLKDIKSYEDPVMVQSVDGVGTKTKVAVMANNFDNLGYDLFSAACNDIAVMGAKPLTFLNYVAHDKLDPEVMEKLVSGMSKACKESGVALVGGETAEMPGVYLPDEIDMVGLITGVCEKDKIINGNNIESGHKLYGINSSGLHTNGFSFARKLLFEVAGYKINENIRGLDKNLGDILLEPHINYTSVLKDIFNTCNEKEEQVFGVAHITGGGVIENIPRILPDNLTAIIDSRSWEVPNIFKILEKAGNVEFYEMHKAFNMGLGLVIVANSKCSDLLKSIVINHDMKLYEIGELKEGSSGVVLTNG